MLTLKLNLLREETAA